MAARRYPIPAAEDIRLVDVLQAVADPRRARILTLLADGQYHGMESFDLELQKSTVSHHLKVLREAGLTETVATGRNCDVRLRRDELGRRFPGLVDALLSPAAVADLARAD